jgi:cytochrome c oxidase subunit II
MKSRVRKLKGLAVLGATTFALGGCASHKRSQNTWDPKGKYAKNIDDLQRPVFLVAGIVGVVVVVAVGMAVMKFRERPGVDFVPHQSHGNTMAEVSLTALSAAILLACAVFTVPAIFGIAKKPANALQINVIGQQWWWEYQYPGQKITTSGEMVVPVGVPIRLNITSRDVIHSYWIPALNGKRDAVPNRIHPLNFQADEAGVFEGQCTEFCGLSHANMREKVIALPQAEFDAWVANQQKPVPVAAKDSQEAKGEVLFIQQCARCHQANGLVEEGGTEPVQNQADEQLVSGAAPNLTHLMSRTSFAGAMFPLGKPGCTTTPSGLPTGTANECLDRAALEAWLRNAPAQKPMYAVLNKDKKYRGMPNLNLTETQIDDLIAYLKTLS